TASASQTEKPNATLDAWLQRRTLDIDDTLSVAPRLTPPQVDTVRWGITLGSSIPVKLIGGASSVQQGWVRFEVLKTISGQLDALPAGTLLFGAPSAHQGSDRLHIHVIKGITPEGEEFELNGWIRAQDGLDGLLGQVVSDGQVLNRSLSAVAQAAGQAALENISPPGVTISALKSGARTAQDEQSQASEATYGRPEYIVQAQAQAATLDIYETF
ncbi:MAG: TrbI/VirB10 family protein, partial [Gammaproteobacteria bacterium]